MNLKQEIGNTDIYLLDQILKGLFSKDHVILDAGCGNGRNMEYFIRNEFNVSGFDRDEPLIQNLKKKHPDTIFSIDDINHTEYDSEQFDRVICNAVLHFAANKIQFIEQFTELLRILKPKGVLFIRMTSDIGIENLISYLGNGVYKIPDGSTRFLITKSLITELLQKFAIKLVQPLKTVNVDDKRCMSTLLFEKVN